MSGNVEAGGPAKESVFDGAWVDDEDAVITIASGKMAGSDGDVLDLELGDGGTCSFRSADGEIYGGILADGGRKLCWSDGVVWVRRPEAAPAVPAPAPGAAPSKADIQPGAKAEAGGAAEPRFKYRPVARPPASTAPAAGSRGPEPAAAEAEKEAPRADRMEVVVRHAIQGVEVKVALPKRAKFKHIKKALAAGLGNDELLHKAQLAKKVGGVYKAYKDHIPVDAVRQVLMVGFDLGSAADDGASLEAALSEGDITEEEEQVPEQEPPAPARAGSAAKSQSLTKKQAISLQSDLYDGFRADPFQKELKRLEFDNRIRNGSKTGPQYQQERQELFLTVQSKVLPKYGFEGTLAGVYQMMGAMGPYLKDPEFVKLASDINRMLGISMPQESWDNLSKSCQTLPASTADAAPRKAGKPLGQQRALPRAPLPPLGSIALPQPGAVAAAMSAIPEEPSPLPGGGRGAGRAAHGQLGQAPAAAELPYEPWPAGKKPYFRLYLAGTWNSFQPVEMEWQGEVFLASVAIGTAGWESFQILKNGSWESTIYPSIPDATPYEEHAVSGPDGRGHGKNWMIGKYTDDQAKPGAQFAVIAGIDRRGKVAVVTWQLMA